MTKRNFFDRKAFFTLLTAAVVSGFIVICTLGQSVHRTRQAAKLAPQQQKKRPN